MVRIIKYICLFVLVMMPFEAAAQRCDVDEEAIFKLRKAQIGAFAIWDGVHGGEDVDERYGAGAMMPSGHVFVAGMRDVLAKPYPEMILAEVDRRGRIVWETKRHVKGLDDVLGVMAFGDDYIVTARVWDREGVSALWLGFFDERGALRREKAFRHSKGSIVNGAIALSQSGKGLVMVAGIEDKRSGAPRFSEFYRLNSKAQVISKRAFNPGPDNGLYDITASKDGHFLASGYVNNARGRKTGWLLKIDDKGGIVWQRQYPRGIGAEFRHADELEDGSIVLAGTALPAQEDALKAGWLMRVDRDNGETQWQRYFTSDLDYTGRGLHVNQDNVITLMLDAKPVESTFAEEGEAVKDYARVVTLNPRGVIFDSQAYFQGEIADAHDLVIGPAGERILIGTTQIAYQKEADAVGGDDQAEEANKPIEKRSLEGWIVATPRAEKYVDPCKPKQERVLNSL